MKASPCWLSRSSIRQKNGSKRQSRSTRKIHRPGTTWAWRNMRVMICTDAVASFQQAVKLDPQDADSWYFEGACYEELQRQFDKAIEVFKKTLEINPLHASAEFGLARALQRTGTRRRRGSTLRAFST